MYQQPTEKSLDMFEVLEQRNKDRDREDRQRRGIVMEPKYYEEDYEKQYEKFDDLNRIVRGTFDVSRYFKPDEFFAQGPWRVEALFKALKVSKLKVFAEQLLKKGFDYVCTHQIDNTEFEKMAESCLKNWNKELIASEPIRSYEQAFLHALSALKKIKPNLSTDPFDNRRVEVLFDKKAGVYIVKKTFDMRPFHQALGGGFYLIAFDVNGQILALPGAFRQ